MNFRILQVMVAALVCASAYAQVNSGSNGSDGAFNPSTNTVINMADHPDGIYQYTSVNIPMGVTVRFIPNVNNASVVWLVQNSCNVDGTIAVDGNNATNSVGATSGPGGYRGGNGSLQGVQTAGAGLGPGGGTVTTNGYPGNASHGTLGAGGNTGCGFQSPPGELYGNKYLIPLIGGSGGGGPGGGGAGAILIAASNSITVSGSIQANGGNGTVSSCFGGCIIGGGGGGSGGAIRLIAASVTGGGTLNTGGGYGLAGYNGGYCLNSAGNGRVRIDALSDTFSGGVSGDLSRGFQPVIIAPPNQTVSLGIQSVAGIAVSANPAASLTTPDVVVPSSQQNIVPIVVRCVNIPLNTDIIIDIKPANGPAVRAVGVNNAGIQASSTATLSINMPRGAGTIQAKAISGIAGSLGASLNNGKKYRGYAQSGLTTDGEGFSKMEITATLGQGQEIACITESGKRFVLPRN